METELTDPEPTVTNRANGDADRGPRGHFAHGNRLGKGNPHARRVHEHRMMFLDAIDAGTIPELARKLQADALGGSEFAIKLLLEYCIGRPSQAVELTGADGESLGLNVGMVTTIVLAALAGPKYAEARIALADKLGG